MSRALSLSTPAFNSDVFLPIKLSGTERINELFSYQLIVKTPNLSYFDSYKQLGTAAPESNVDITSWLGQNLTVGIEVDGKEVEFSEVNNTFRLPFTETIGQGTRYISGIITRACYLYNNERSNYYGIELRPFLHNATLKSDYKIFQNLNVIEILDEVLSPYSGTVEKRLNSEQQARFPTRLYQSQHGETDYQFFSRLCSEFGINYFFYHTDNNHTLVLSDEPHGHHLIQNPAYQTIAYYPPDFDDTTHVKEEHLHEFNLTAQVVSGAFANIDYDYSQASITIRNEQHNIQPYPEARQKGVATNGKEDTETEKNTPVEIAQRQHEIYEYAADVVQPKVENAETETPYVPGGGYAEEHQFRNQWELERIQQTHFTASATGHIRGIVCGHRFLLNKHPNALANIHWTVLGAELLVLDLFEESQRKEAGLPSLLSVSAKDNTPSDAFYSNIQNKLKNLKNLRDTSEEQWQIDCRAELIPANIAIRPNKVDKPKASLQNALVVGESGNDALYTDPLGRIKVQFCWDRYGTRNEHSSCWVRVNQPWAGNQMGASFTPRVGQEVLIDYINNDPDLPVCVGKVNNSNNTPDWVLPQNKALSGFRSREMPQGNSSSGRSNHLVFDDSAGNIQTQLKSDHAHSQLSLGDITRIEDNAGRKDARGQGFELRTDDWGVNRAAKGLYFTTYARDSAASTTMDATEAQQLLEEARQLVKQLSKLAVTHEAEALSATEPLAAMAKTVKTDTAEQATAEQQDNQPQKAGSTQPKGFGENVLVGAGEAGIALVTPRETHQYSAEKHSITTGQDLNISTGNSWLASIQNKMSLFVQQGVKIFSGKGKIQIQANRNNIEMIADKTVKVISANDKVEVIAKKEILITCNGAYIRIKDGNINLHAPGTIEQKAAVHPFMGATSLAKEMPRLPTSELNIKNQFALVNNFYGVRMPNQKYKVTLEDGTVYQGKSNDKGETEIIESHIPQKAKVEILDNKTGRMFSFSEFLLSVDNSDYNYKDDEVLVASTENIGGGLPKNDNYCSTDKVKLRSVIMADYDFGLRLVESCPKDAKGNEWRYPVAEDYYRSICPALDNAVNWTEMCVEIDKLEELERGVESGSVDNMALDAQRDAMNKAYYKTIAKQIKQCCHAALQSSKAGLFKTPVSLPELPATSSQKVRDPMEFKFYIGEPPAEDGTTSNDNFNYDKNSSVAGMFTHGGITLHMSINPKYIHRFARLQASQSPEKIFDLIGCRSDLIGIMYHETRHYQQYFWATVYAQLFPEDFFQNADMQTQKGFSDYLNNVMTIHLAEYIKKHEGRLREALTCQSNNHLKLGLKRILVASLYRARVTKEAEDEGRLNTFQRAIVQLCDKVFKQPGEGGENIDYRLFHEYRLMSTGYYLTPYEDDAHATQELLIYYEKMAFEKVATPYNTKVINRKNADLDKDMMFFSKKVTKASWVPEELPKPTDHNIQYPKTESRNP